MAVVRPNPTLSEDLISEILIRVPVKSLLRFQSVSKTWLSLIKDPAFVKAQLHHAITMETDHTLIINPYTCRFSYMSSSEENKILLLHVDSREIAADLKFSYSRGEFKSVPDIRVVGSANGIVCIAIVTYFKTKREKSIYLWNPAIRQSKLIPSSGHELRARAFGFGYDPIDRDFKFVMFGFVFFSFFAEVYSGDRNVWRKGKRSDPFDNLLYGDFDVCVNGFLFGIGERGMMVFDLNKEVLNCAIKLPVISILGGDESRIIEFNKSIAVIISWDYELYDDKKIEMWTLDDDACLGGGGVEASWTLMFSVDLGMPSYFIHGYFSNGDLLIILHDAYVCISCNIETKEAEIVPLSVDMTIHPHTRHTQYTRNIYKYTESLVSVAGFKQVDWNR